MQWKNQNQRLVPRPRRSILLITSICICNSSLLNRLPLLQVAQSIACKCGPPNVPPITPQSTFSRACLASSSPHFFSQNSLVQHLRSLTRRLSFPASQTWIHLDSGHNPWMMEQVKLNRWGFSFSFGKFLFKPSLLKQPLLITMHVGGT